jgi:hypothetical protein
METEVHKDDQKCQIDTIPRLGSSITDREIGPISPVMRVKLMLKRRLDSRKKRMLKTNFNQLASTMMYLMKREPELAVQELTLQSNIYKSGDMVRIRSKEAIESTLDSWGELRGCRFMDGMDVYCGTVQRVWKPVRRFVDERDYRVKKTQGVYILEGLICNGTEVYGSCDRSCFFFWRDEWLEKIDQDVPS